MSSRYPKRKRADDAGDGNNDGNHKQQNHYSKRPKTSKNPDNKNPYTQRGRLKGANGKNTDEEEQKSINALKNRIRDLSRSLRHVDSNEKNRMPQGIRIERERELESCKHELEEKQTAQREAKFKRDIISKYHMVRFFERQKATRTLKKLNKQLAALDPNTEAQKADRMRKIKNAEVDLNYTLYYPLLKPYISLYPRKGGGQQPDGSRGDIDVWKKVERAMEEHSLEELRESKEGVIIPGAPKEDEKKSGKDKVQEKASKDADVEMEDRAEEDSDDGFFA